MGNEKRASISYKKLPQEVKEGNTILINDGLLELKVDEITDKDIICTGKVNFVGGIAGCAFEATITKNYDLNT